MNGRVIVAAITIGVAGVACTKSLAGSSSSGGASNSSGGETSTGAAPGSSSGGTGPVTSSGTGSGTTSATGGGAAGTTGTTTDSPFVDGGYVFCFLASAADAGPNGDAGSAAWMCRPGTYFCDLSGDIGNCLQCRSDQDCASKGLPTYDPLRPRCDLDSGVVGYQDFCVGCLSDSDCAGDPAGAFCDLSPTYPPNALEPPIEALGFETCGQIQTDCRLEGGPLCLTANQICDPFNGRCEDRSPSCSTDQDCVGVLGPPPDNPGTGSPYLLRPYCVSGTCNACDGGVCPNNNACESDADCGNSTSSLTGLRCELFEGSPECVCTSGSQCGGFWPGCVGLDAGNASDAGQAVGICTCDSDEQCGDGGLVCLPAGIISGPQAGSNFCGVPCTSPDFPSCQALTGYDICDIQDRTCGGCGVDEQCMSSVGSGGPFCSNEIFLTGGVCLCILDADCPAGDSCVGICVPSFSRCTPETCDGYFCNWDSGTCVNIWNAETFPSCVVDADCSHGFCVEGTCAGCRDNTDCIHAGQTVATFCCSTGRTEPACLSAGAAPNSCVDSCGSDLDCVGNAQGPSCLSLAGGKGCGCDSDADCLGGASGPHCDTNPEDNGLFGRCTCVDVTECSAGWSCEPKGSADAGSCSPYCEEGLCPAGFACDSNNLCQLGCLDSRDCDGGLGCSGNACQPCVRATDCAVGTVCVADGLCHASCDAGPCPTGEHCDALDEAGGGSNVCYQCVSAADCPDEEGCDSQRHSCGTCRGPNAQGGPYDCPPDAVCSDYWVGGQGVCLPNCDRESCPADRPICAVSPSLTPDHKYCFGCLRDSDCGDAGSWCDQSFNRTFTCQAAGT